MIRDIFSFYTLLRPIRPEYIDDGTKVIALVPLHAFGHDIEAALLGDPTEPHMVRISVYDLPDPPTDELRSDLDDQADTFLSLVRIYHDPGIAFAEPRFRYASHVDRNTPLRLHIKVEESPSDYQLNLELTSTMMGAKKEFRDILYLYADAIHPYNLPQYRYLSAFKILEHDLKKSRHKWRSEFDSLLVPFEEEYRIIALGSMSLKAYLIGLRDQCAHIKVGDADIRTFVGTKSPKLGDLLQAIQLILKIVRQHIAQIYQMNGQTPV